MQWNGSHQCQLLLPTMMTFLTRYLSVATDTKMASSPTRTFSPSDLCLDEGWMVHQQASPSELSCKPTSKASLSLLELEDKQAKNYDKTKHDFTVIQKWNPVCKHLPCHCWHVAVRSHFHKAMSCDQIPFQSSVKRKKHFQETIHRVRFIFLAYRSIWASCQ